MIADLLAEHGSPLWLVDLDRVRERLREFRAAWEGAWPDVAVAYSCKTNRMPAILRTLVAQGAGQEVVCEAEYLLAREVAGCAGEAIVVNGPAKPAALLERAGADHALVIVDSEPELDRAAAAGARRVGLRIATPGVGAGPSRFGIPAAEAPAAARRAGRLGLAVEALAAHLVSTGFDGPLTRAPRLGGAIVVQWPQPPARYAHVARTLAALAVRLGTPTVDLGGGFPAAPAVAAHARSVAGALGAASFEGRLLLEPGRAIVGDAVDLACTVMAVKRLADGTRCAIVDAGTNLLPGALWTWPRVEAAQADSEPAGPVLVSGPLCLNVDVLHPAVELGPLAAGDVLLVRAVGAYHQAQSTRFGELRPAAVARDGGRWRPCQRRETLEDLLAGDRDPVAAGARMEEEQP